MTKEYRFKGLIHNHIKEYRKLFYYTQTQLANFLGVSKNTISMWEQGDFSPSLINICLMCDLFNCKFEDLFSYDYITHSREDT